MPESWQQWYPHKIDKWQGSGSIIALSDAAYRVVHQLTMAAWQSEDGFLPSDEKQLAKLGLAVKQGDYSAWEKVKEEVFDYFTRSEDGRLFHPVIMKERTEAQRVFETGQAKWEQIRQKRKEAGERGNEARWSQNDRKTIANRSQDGPKDIAKDRLTGTVTVTETKQEPPTPLPPSFLDPAMISRKVMKDAAISSDQVWRAVEGQVRLEVGNGCIEDEADAVVSRMVTSWQRFQKATPRLEFKWAAQKFFGEGYWRNEHNWPWKPGESPPIAKLKDLGHERAQKHFKEMEDARKQAEREREEDAVRMQPRVESG